ncbi:MAG: nucleoside hydrolase [Suipraeoptans sp.]
MKRADVLKRLGFIVPECKKKRVIIHADIAAEADDQFAIVHHLLSPSEDVVGIIVANYEWRFRVMGPMIEERVKKMEDSGMPAETFAAMKNKAAEFAATRLMTTEKSYAEGKRILELMDIDDVMLVRGSKDCITDRDNLPVSEGSEMIIKEAMKEDDEPLYIALQGTLTDLAVAYLTEPKIAERIKAAIWIGGASYPNGGQESNLQQDIYAAQVIFDSPINLWQVPVNAYGGMNLSFAELVQKVQTKGKLGAFLAGRMFEVNDWYADMGRMMEFPHGELWSVGDQPTVSALLENAAGQDRHIEKAPHIADDMSYLPNPEGRDIYVYDSIDRRLTMEDFFAKLDLCYGKEN